MRVSALDWILAAVTVVGLIAASVWVVASLRRRQLGVDVVAVLALAGSLAVGEYLAGALITAMLATGRALEARANARAERELHALLAHAPRVAHLQEGTTITSVDLDSVRPGDLLLVQPGEVVPVDGLVEDESAVLDESTLTGEARPVSREPGDQVRSGTVNAGAPFRLRSTTSAAESTYAGVVRLVKQARASSAPFVRLADRYAVGFVPVALAIAGAAWLLSGDPVRAVAVLVVATPCPLLLAAPIAIVSGLSRAARRGVIIKGGAALERLAEARVLLFDKTGTLTAGRPTLAEIVTRPGFDEPRLLHLAASLDQVSPHVLAAAIVRASRHRGLELALPDDVEEVPGHGVRGIVDGHTVTVGRAAWALTEPLPDWARTVRRRAERDGAVAVFVQVDDMPAGALLLDDPIRPDAARTVRALRRAGIERTVMVTGDRGGVGETVGAVLGVDEVLAERTPAEKVDAVRLEARYGPTMMVGDGINDAPALAAATVGVAMGARGATASSETADVVLTVDRLDRLGDALLIARRTRRIAHESVFVGMGLSLTAMIGAAFGFIPPAAGALLQEAIDVAVILNALRVTIGRPEQQYLEGVDAVLGRRFSGEHRQLRPDLTRIRAAADGLGMLSDAEALAQVRAVHQFLVDELLPHEEAEDAELYPVLARVLGGADPTGPMSRAHVEIAHLVRRLGWLLDDLAPTGPTPDDLAELRRVLYGLDAVLRLHFAQEDEGYLSLADEADVAPKSARSSGRLRTRP